MRTNICITWSEKSPYSIGASKNNELAWIDYYSTQKCLQTMELCKGEA